MGETKIGGWPDQEQEGGQECRPGLSPCRAAAVILTPGAALPHTFPGERVAMLMRALVLLSCASFISAAPSRLRAGDKEAVPGIGPAGKVAAVKGGFVFSAGPAADADGNVFFSDIALNKIFKIDKDRKVSVFYEKPKDDDLVKIKRPAGLRVNAKGELVICVTTGRVIAFPLKEGKRRVVADRYEGE